MRTEKAIESGPLEDCHGAVASVAPSQAPSSADAILRELVESNKAVAAYRSADGMEEYRRLRDRHHAALKRAHDYVAAPVMGMEATSPLPKCMCGQSWVLNTVHRANSPCWLAQEPPGGLGPNPDGFATPSPSPEGKK